MISEHFARLQSCIDPDQKIEINFPAGVGSIYCHFKNMTVIGMSPDSHALMQAMDFLGNFHYFDIFDVVSVSVQIHAPIKHLVGK